MGDADGSGKVSLEEWSNFLTAGLQRHKLGEFSEIMSILTIHDNCFDEIDTDHSGLISWYEFEAWIALMADKEGDPELEVNRLRNLLDDRQKLMADLEMSPEQLAAISKRHEEVVRCRVESEMAKQN